MLFPSRNAGSEIRSVTGFKNPDSAKGQLQGMAIITSILSVWIENGLDAASTEDTVLSQACYPMGSGVFFTILVLAPVG